ncbi:MAG: UDP-N-acetylmuramate dehydrogenase, partial [Lactobacillales bacterium]|nr:UDP-N-acetylmuramate dehydrogenase [Lactobacillales bacterium]
GTLIHRLPPVRGKLSLDMPLCRKNLFGVGGLAQAYFEPADLDDLLLFLRYKPENIPVTLLGAGSNVLISDKGVPGITIHLGPSFSEIVVEGDHIRCLGNANVIALSKEAEKAGLAGFEFLSGIPGTLGGAIRMNAGAHGNQIADCLVSLTLVDFAGRLTEAPADQKMFSYRHSSLPPDVIIVGAVLRGDKKPDAEEISKKMRAYAQKRKSSQPLKVKTAGSFFKNPAGLFAGKLIEDAGLKGFSVGDAVVSDVHANFIVNAGRATSADIARLAKKIQEKILKKDGILLEWEVKKIGEEEDI